jgi:hypothetical protein
MVLEGTSISSVNMAGSTGSGTRARWSPRSPVPSTDSPTILPSISPILTTAYGFGLVKSHPCRDGDKRIAFLTMAVFLKLNGRQFTATDEAVVKAIMAATAGTLSERRLPTWVRRNSRQIT